MTRRRHHFLGSIFITFSFSIFAPSFSLLFASLLCLQFKIRVFWLKFKEASCILSNWFDFASMSKLKPLLILYNLEQYIKVFFAITTNL